MTSTPSYRKTGPTIHSIGDLVVPDWETVTLPNGTRVVEVNMGTQQLVSMEIIHFASRRQEDKKGVARAVARLLREGSAQYDSETIAKQIDYYGASMSTGANLDFSFIKLFSLTKYFGKLLPYIEDLRYNPTFPEKELERYKLNSKQKLAVDNAKVELKAYKILTEYIFGSDHVYGYNSTEQIYDDISIADVQHHFDTYYGSDNCLIVLSGHITPEVRKLVYDTFGTRTQHVTRKPYKRPTIAQTYRKHVENIDNKSQSGIKLGTQLWNRQNDDFSGMFVLNTVLGGYFGSRLMSSIREEKGYTYSIYSGLDMMKDDGYFFVSTEVGNEYVDKTIEAIYHEIDRLQQELVSDAELDMIKNYIRGNFLNMIDGPFKNAGLIKMHEVNQLDKHFFADLSRYVRDAQADEIQRLAQKYLRKDRMTEVIVG